MNELLNVCGENTLTDLAFDHVDLCLVIVDALGTIHKVNRKFSDVFNPEGVELYGRNLFDFVECCSHSRFELDPGNGWHVEFKCGMEKSGKLEYRRLNLPGSMEKFFLCQVFVEKEDELSCDSLLTNCRLRNLALKSADAGTFFLDFETDELKWDEKSLEIFGLEKHEFKGNYSAWRDMVHPDDKEITDNQIAYNLKNDSMMNLHYRIVKSCGEEAYIWAVAYIIRDENGTPTQLSGLHFDETKGCLMEKKLRESNELLEQFAMRAAHDLMSPLSSIIMNVKSIRYSLDNGGDKLDNGGDKLDEHFDYIRILYDNMQVLMKSLLEHARIGNNGGEEAVDLNLIVQNVRRNLESEIAESGAEINCSTLPKIVCRYGDMEVLFQNLISNAIKFRYEDRPLIVNIDVQDKRNSCIISVSDNGIGVEKERQEQIFVLFERGGTKSGYGSGIGLASCTKVMEAYGGKIWVDSIVGKGSTFYIRFPRCRKARDK